MSRNARLQGAVALGLAAALVAILGAARLEAANPAAGAVPALPQAPPPASVSPTAASGNNGAPPSGILDLSTKSGGAPVAIEADQGVEWDQNAQRYIARGNAKAVRGDNTVYAQVLTAYYRKTASGGSDVWRVEADNDIRITSPNGTVLGDRAIYDVDNSVFVITGKKLSLNSPRVNLTARDSLEYYQQKQIAVARGNAVATRETRTISADVLEAHFNPDKDGNLQMTRLEAFDHVVITTPSSTARGLYGDYDFASGVAVLKGSVKITRGQDQLDGDCAEVNTATGVSRIYPCGTANEQVRGLLVPRQGEGGKTPSIPLLPGASASSTKSGGGVSKSSTHGKMKPEPGD
jgi:lipopolysaccharide export system protein LptA